MRDACKYYFNQQQIPGRILGRWFHIKYFLTSPRQIVFVCLFFFSKESEKMSSVTTLTATRNVLFRPQTKLLDFKIFLSDRAAFWL